MSPRLATAQTDRACGVLLGAAAGDALGAGYEFEVAVPGPDGPRMIGGGLGVWYSYTQRQFFVGPDGATVAIFKGVPEPVLNLPLSRLVEADTTRLDDLPPYYQEQVRATIRADSLASARGIVASLRVKAHECIAQREARATATPTAAIRR